MSNQDQSPAWGREAYNGPPPRDEPDHGVGQSETIEPPRLGITLSDLSTLPRWVVWRTELKGTRVTKVPKSPRPKFPLQKTTNH